MISIASLIACGVAPTQAKVFAEPLRKACERYEINTLGRVASFLAQACHESSNFTRLEENLYYKTPERLRAVFPSRIRDLGTAAKYVKNPQGLANLVYANRLGNGDSASGDGWKYRGSGIFQLTGRANFMAAGDAIGLDYKANPQWVRENPQDACLTAAWFWTAIHANELADSAQIDRITAKVNGPAMLGADERRSRYDDNLRALA